jgi:DNA-binding MarR family transcriptional regulator
MSGAVDDIDRESAMGGDERLELRVWLRLLTCSALLERRIRAFLHDRFGISLARFDLMAQLDRSMDGMTMGALSSRLMVSNGNVTGLIDRMAAEGLVERMAVATDRRSQRVRLTPAGRQQFAEMAPAHGRFVAEAFAGAGRGDLRDLHQRLGALKLTLQRGR